MADQKNDPQPKAPSKAAPAQLGSAGESSDPRVHQLLAARDIADSNGDTGAVKAATAALADLGVE